MRQQPHPLPPWAIQVCRLWRRSEMRGFALAGNWGGVKVLIYENPEKRDPDDADFVLCFAPPLRKTLPRPSHDYEMKKDTDR